MSILRQLQNRSLLLTRSGFCLSTAEFNSGLSFFAFELEAETGTAAGFGVLGLIAEVVDELPTASEPFNDSKMPMAA